MDGKDSNVSKPIEMTCCFCGGDVLYDQATKLIVVAPGDDAGDQVLYCHGAHLRAAVLEMVPLHPNVAESGSGDG